MADDGKPRHVVVAREDILGSTGESRHSATTKAVLHQVAEAETALFRLRPGGRIKSHSHSAVWDLFLGIDGEVTISWTDGTQEVSSMVLARNGFVAVPPGWSHEVVNHSTAREAAFVLIHAPWEGYDHLPDRRAVQAGADAPA